VIDALNGLKLDFPKLNEAQKRDVVRARRLLQRESRR
jgi:hypothetical protein